MTARRLRSAPSRDHQASARAFGLESVSWLIVAATVIALPVLVTPTGKDIFRLGKHISLEVSAIALAAISVAAALWGCPVDYRTRWRPFVRSVIGAACIWSTITTFSSTNLLLSIFSLLTFMSAVMFFVASYCSVQWRSLPATLTVAFLPAVINAIAAIIQRAGLWMPFPIDVTTLHENTTAFIGNPNDVGMFLVAPTIAAVTLAVCSKDFRLQGIMVAATLIAGLVASETLGAILAAAAGIFVLLFSIRRRLAVFFLALSILLGLAVVRSSPVRWTMTKTKVGAVAHGDVDLLLSGRVLPFLAAWQMFVKDPAFGVGPGCFTYRYFDEKIAVELQHPWLMDRRPENYGEVHNEHLQILAETGLPGYAVAIAAAYILLRCTRRQPSKHADMRAVFAHTVAMPFVVAIGVLALSSFPFHLAAPTVIIVYFSAVTAAWSEHALV